MLLKDHFDIQGPNGTHSCLVYEALGPSVITMSMDRVSGEAMMEGQDKRFTLSAARSILHQVLLGLDFIHSRGLVHGDFHSGNWLFSLREMSNVSIEDVRPLENRVSAPVRRLDGSSSCSAPPFLTLDQPLREWIATGNDLQVKISDLGSGKWAVVYFQRVRLTDRTAFYADFPPTNPQTPVNLRSPELLLRKHSSTAQDIWAFGCLVYSLLTNTSLVELFDMGDRNYLDDDHILQMIELLGPLPADLKSAWLRYRNYFDENDVQTVFVVDWTPSLGSLDENLTEEEDEEKEKGEHRAESDMNLPDSKAEEEEEEEEAYKARWRAPESANAVPTQQLYPSLVEVVYDSRSSHALGSDLGEGSDTHARPVEPPLRDRWLRDKHPAMAPDEAEAVASLLQQILQYDPADRPTTTDLLRHPWIEKFCASRGTGAVP